MDDLKKEELVDSRITICHYCRQFFRDEHKRECWKCNVHHLIRYVFNYEGNSCINNINEKDTITYIQELDGLSPFETWSYEHHPLYHKAGIYGIYIDEVRDKRLVYIGKSKNIYVRWIYHTQNIFDEGDESNRKIYEELRNAYIHEHDIIFKVLEFCYDTDNEKTLNKMEDEWISKCEPPYNIIIPDGNGGHIKKEYFEYVYYDEYDYYKNDETGDYELRLKYDVAMENLHNKIREQQIKINTLKVNHELECLRNKRNKTE